MSLWETSDSDKRFQALSQLFLVLAVPAVLHGQHSRRTKRTGKLFPEACGPVCGKKRQVISPDIQRWTLYDLFFTNFIFNWRITLHFAVLVSAISRDSAAVMLASPPCQPSLPLTPPRPSRLLQSTELGSRCCQQLPPSSPSHVRSVCISTLFSPFTRPLLPHCTHRSVLYARVSVPALPEDSFTSTVCLDPMYMCR